MRPLNQYLRKHAERFERSPANASPGDVFFFDVRSKGADAEALTDLVRGHHSDLVKIDMFDGQEHNFIEVGAWLGDQGDALTLLGLGAQLGLWQLLTPKTVLGADVPADVEERLAGAGMISVVAKKS